MKYTVKNKAISLNGGSIVYNEKHENVFKVSGNFIKNIFGLHTKKIKDKDGKKLFVVRNKFWHKPFFRSAIIYANGKKIATVTDSHLIKNGYEVIGATEPITVEGTGWNLDIKLGNKIRYERVRRHLSQEKLAELANMNMRTISTIECGTTDIKFTTLNKIAVALDVKLKNLVEFVL